MGFKWFNHPLIKGLNGRCIQRHEDYLNIFGIVVTNSWMARSIVLISTKLLKRVTSFTRYWHIYLVVHTLLDILYIGNSVLFFAQSLMITRFYKLKLYWSYIQLHLHTTALSPYFFSSCILIFSLLFVWCKPFEASSSKIVSWLMDAASLIILTFCEPNLVLNLFKPTLASPKAV